MEFGPPTFEKYANFDNDKEATLPLKEHGVFSDEEKDIFQGAYASVFETINGDEVIKINRLLRYSPNKENPVEFADYDDINYLAEKAIPIDPTEMLEAFDKEVQDRKKVESIKADDEKRSTNEINREAAIRKMLEFAEYKKGIYKKLNKHISKHLPKFYGFAIVDSPRREVESRMSHSAPDTETSEKEGGKKSKRVKLTPEQLKQIPKHEIALMEVWENVNAKNALNSRGFENLKQLHKYEEFKEEQKSLADGLISLLMEDGIMVDICDHDGIRAFSSKTQPDGSNKETTLTIKTVEDTIRLLGSSTEEVIAYPRNTVFNEGRMIFIDTYPINEVERFSDNNELIKKIAYAIENERYEELVKIAGDQKTNEGNNMRRIIQYLGLLKYMGADLTKIEA